MGYLGRRIGLSQDSGDPNPGAANGAVGGGILDLFENGYFERQGGIYNDPGIIPVPVGMTASGGIIHDYTTSPGDVYRAHIFTSSGTFNVTEPGDFTDTLEYLVVAGGGGGGGYSGANGGGGGGAGGLRTNLSGHPKAGAAYPVPAFPTSYTVTIGAGGVFQASPAPGTTGNDSEFYPTPQSYPSTTRVRSVGGGGGGYNPTSGLPGGSSGGGAAPTSSIVAGNANPDPNHPQPAGNAGGHGASNNSRAGGGGGGAGSDGGNASGSYPDDSKAGYGGKALQVLIAGPSSASPMGTPGESGQGWYAGGGGGAGADQTLPDARRGIGGRGNDRTGTTRWGGGGNGAPGGPTAVPRDSMNGDESTGGGGGGGRLSENPGGNGGSGVVIVRYQIGSVKTEKASGGSISFFGGKTIHTFTSAGDFNNTSGGNLSCDVVMIAGGGGGGHNEGGGGGAGGYIFQPGRTVGTGPHGIIIGAGGRIQTGSGGDGVPGSDTTFDGLTAKGGGAGGNWPAGAGDPGGSGGGGASNSGSAGPTSQPGQSGDSGTYGSGFAGGAGGGNGSQPPYAGGGGGGAGGEGGAAASDANGHGGIGKQIPAVFHDPASGVGAPGPTATNVAGGTPGKFWIGGGGGGGSTSQPPGKGGGSGGPYAGGGDGTSSSPQPEPLKRASHGEQNTGGGGGSHGAGTNNTTTPRIGHGGSGIVLIAYPT